MAMFVRMPRYVVRMTGIQRTRIRIYRHVDIERRSAFQITRTIFTVSLRRQGRRWKVSFRCLKHGVFGLGGHVIRFEDQNAIIDPAIAQVHHVGCVALVELPGGFLVLAGELVHHALEITG